MFTTGSKWFFGLAAAAFVAALVYAGATNANEVGMSTFTGALSFGYKGGVGDHIGYAILMGIAGAALFLGAVIIAFRDAEVQAEAELLELETVPEVETPEQGSYWPLVGAFGVAVLTVGLVTTSALFLLGLVILAAVAFEWAITAWAEKATGDPEVNAAIRRRVMLPIEVPVLGGLGVAIVVISISRILLAVPKLGVYLLFGIFPVMVLIVAAMLATRPKINRDVVVVLCVLGGLGVLVGGVVSAAVGPREIEKHEPEGESSGAPLVAPDAPVTVSGSTR